ncbi:hypothetical protein RFI_02756 [Reticulomyxa filosa]|uniref:TRAF-type domain-containing protein n=1 Tax=Reticulomyxa filosa TaxID=46433 RepID=X6P895_RETFI|nr:hypothetical protein RFI_02756 [Reticulomyxa filosa]|eukprot:ETO34338.1 hypothetical protein RFI_02756 [Reticulomyxa filosa]
MLLLHEEETKTKKLNNLSLEGCYDKNWISSSNKPRLLRNLQCLLCKQIANNAMEIICNEHEDHKETVLIGEKCLKQYLNEHNNKCPIGNHDHCNYVKGQTARNFISELKVICPRQFGIDLNIKTNIETKEGDTSTEIETKKQYCIFKGKIEEVKNHLQNECCLKPLECKFKEFGCDDILFNFNFQKHLQLKGNQHSNLLLNNISILQNKIQQYQSNENNTQILKSKIEEQEQYIHNNGMKKKKK